MVAKNYKLSNTFIHTELWKRGSRIDLVEVIGVLAAVHLQFTIACTMPLCTKQQHILPVESLTNAGKSHQRASLRLMVLACRSMSPHLVKVWHQTFSTTHWLTLLEREKVSTTAMMNLVFDSLSKKTPGSLPHRPMASFLQASISLVQASKMCTREERTSCQGYSCSPSTHQASVICDVCAVYLTLCNQHNALKLKASVNCIYYTTQLYCFSIFMFSSSVKGVWTL